MKTHFLKAACLATAAALIASQASAADLTINSVNESLSIVDNVAFDPIPVNVSFSSTNLAGATITESFSGFSGTLTSAYSGLSGVFGPKFSFSVPVAPGGNADTLIRGTSTVLFTANQDHHLKSVSGGGGFAAVSGTYDDVTIFRAQTDVFLVSKLFDLTSNTLIRRVSSFTGDPIRTIDGVDPGPNVEPNYLAFFPEDAVLLQMGHQYSFTLEVEARTAFSVPNQFGQVLTGDVLTANGRHGMSFDVTAVTAVPEPEAYALMLAGLGLVGFMAKRRKAR